MKPSLLVRFILPAIVLAGTAVAQTRDPLPVPDVPGYKTLKADFHTHTVFSDGQVWPTTRINEAWAEGLDAISITDHAGYNPHKEDVSMDLTRPFTLARPLAERAGIILIPGVEVMQGDIHFNALFVKDPNALFGLPMLEALRRLRAEDAFAFWNHPGWKETPAWSGLVAEAHSEKLFQGIELVNGNNYYPEALPWIEEKGLTILCNSDIHAPTTANYQPRTRPLTLVFARTADADGVREALFARRTAAWMGGEVWGAEQYLNGLWEGAVNLENPELKSGTASRQLGLRLRNRSALPFQVRVVSAPAWLRAGRPVEIRPESIVPLVLSVDRDAPAGVHSAEVVLQVTNFHLSTGGNLMVRLRPRIEVVK